MSPINGSGPSQSEADGRWEEKNVLCDQIKEIIAALNDIRSQLAEQNKYLDVLTETYVRKPAPTHIIFADELETRDWDAGSDWGDYVEFAQEESPEGAREQEQEDAEVYEGTRGGFAREEEDYEVTLAGFQEGDTRGGIHEIESAPTRDQLEETVLAEKTEDVQTKNQRLLGSASTVPSTCYLPLGLVISLFCMRFLNAKQSAHASQASFTTIFIILSLAAYIFAIFTLWFLREEDWVKRVIGSWKLASTNSSANRADQDQGSRFPDLLRRRRALETS
ncbi:hypothetical protein BDW71DRAFT_190995 [Aspergillus fruticulosus]